MWKNLWRKGSLSLAAIALASLAVTGLSGCNPKSAPDKSPQGIVAKTVDHHSYARPSEARVRHVDLDLKVDFAKSELSGMAALTLETQADAKQVVLDTKGLDILSVTDASGGALKYSLGVNDFTLGRPLMIELPQGAQKVIVHYKTTKDSDALQWLTPAQTAGKKHPFLFSQGESIFTRTWIPTQDSPAIRQTYSARIVVPSGLRAVMSAQELSPKGEPVAGDAGLRAYRFDMQTPIAPYLIAIAVGDLEFAPISERTGVWAEPATLKRAAHEFVDLEKMLGTAEKLYGPYVWGRYDILILPPSFPFGGMENPRLTFATPTILAGDRSLVSLAAHEMAHSWSGNLVTNATWEDFWLNEGFTNYFENRIMEELYGKDRAMMLQALEYKDLLEDMQNFNKANQSNFNRLHPDLLGLSPEDAYSEVPYEKGAMLLRLIEHEVGRKRFDAYLKGYFTRYAFQAMTTEAFVQDVEANLIHHDPLLEDRIRLKSWLYGTDIPSNALIPKSDAFVKVDQEIAAFKAGHEAKNLKTEAYSTQEWQYFIQNQPETLSLDEMRQLDQAFDFSRSHNSEIQFAWFRLAIKHHYEPALAPMRQFLLSQGRGKFVKPLYADLMAQKGWGPEMAKAIYQEARPGYHALIQAALDETLRSK